ncbi:SCO family protein [Oceanicoccus sp. KOV_DT_Chl]|uniref:SCO family protein n=1 Tax=Oceanicoccus sp. KOV_DT_Chl TaxID=1904639 RepID=UPI000C7C33A9|nr:SCO family protein [Oceanicoccus sp. KOV_DT_Chl]
MATEQHNGLRPEQKRGIYLTVGIAVTTVSFLVAMFVLGLSRPVVLSDEELKAKGTFIFDNPRSFKEFSLVDYQNKPFTPEAFQGKWSLVFFGFTYCPDVCPTTLALLNHFYAGQLEGDYADDLQVILVSVDPGRDTPEKLYDYVQFFNKDFIGVTGEFLDLHRFATQLNIPFSKVPGGGENYTVEHGGNIAIINPNGHYVGFFRTPITLSGLNIGYQSIRASRG